MSGQATLFVYDTLLVPEIMQRVVGRVPPSAVATLSGYKCRKLCGMVYPGILPAAETITQGRIYTGISAEELSALERYEGAEYERQAVLVQIVDCETEADGTPAEVFVLRAEYASRLSEQEFALTQFLAMDLEAFLQEL